MVLPAMHGSSTLLTQQISLNLHCCPRSWRRFYLPPPPLYLCNITNYGAFLRKLCCAALFFAVVSVSRCAASKDFETTIRNLVFREGVAAALSRKRVALVCKGSPVHHAVAEDIRNALQSIKAIVVFTDNSIIKAEVDRQLSGIVDDDYVVGVGHQYGAEIVLEVAIFRESAKTRRVKVALKGVDVRQNTLVAHAATALELPSRYNIHDIILPEVSTIDTVKEAATQLADSGTAGVYSEEPKPVKPPREPIKLPPVPQIDWSFLTDGETWWGANIGSTGYIIPASDTSDSIGGSFGVEYGIDHLCFELDPIILSSEEPAFGLDIMAGYLLWWYDDRILVKGYYDDDFRLASVIVSGGISLLPDNLIPFAQIKLDFACFRLGYRIGFDFSLDGFSVVNGFTAGFSWQWKSGAWRRLL